MVLNEVSRFIKEKKSFGENIIVPKIMEDLDESSFSSNAEFKKKDAEIVEGLNKTLEIKQVKINAQNSSFAYFLDGIERKKLLFNYNFTPVIYGYVSAVIMKRTDKKMHTIDFEDSSEKLYLPYKQDDDSPSNYFNIKDFENFNLVKNIYNTGKKDVKTGKYPLYPKEFEKKAHSDIQETRGRIERGLAKKWQENNFNDGWLFVDGRLENKNNELKTSSNIVGVIKSHHAYYFDLPEQNMIYNLKKGERTLVFQPENENIFSWYLRLHESKTGGLDFGIIRIEIPANESLLNKVDEISGWILLERNPVAFPASRWDRMIYPIKYCEDYLKSKAPSYTKIESIA